VVLALACSIPAAAQTKPATAPAAAKMPAPPAAGPCTLQITGNDLMQFDKKELRASSTCKSVDVVLIHGGKLPATAMGHNFVVTKTADLQPVASAALAAGVKNHYVPPGDKRVIAASNKLVGGGEWLVVTVPMAGMQKGGDYSFFCTFPGHSGIMKGKFIVL
jgi:azurin